MMMLFKSRLCCFLLASFALLSSSSVMADDSGDVQLGLPVNNIKKKMWRYVRPEFFNLKPGMKGYVDASKAQISDNQQEYMKHIISTWDLSGFPQNGKIRYDKRKHVLTMESSPEFLEKMDEIVEQYEEKQYPIRNALRRCKFRMGKPGHDYRAIALLYVDREFLQAVEDNNVRYDTDDDDLDGPSQSVESNRKLYYNRSNYIPAVTILSDLFTMLKDSDCQLLLVYDRASRKDLNLVLKAAEGRALSIMKRDLPEMLSKVMESNPGKKLLVMSISGCPIYSLSNYDSISAHEIVEKVREFPPVLVEEKKESSSSFRRRRSSDADFEAIERSIFDD